MAARTTVPFIDLCREYEEVRSDVASAVSRVLDSGWFVLGNEVTQFEKAFAEYVATKYAVGVNSGSDALFLALKALGIGKTDEVITVSHTMVSTADAIIRCGAKPVFVDIAPDTYCIDGERIEERITERTKAILPVHIYGHPAELDRITKLAKQYDLFVVEDACQAHGAEYKGKKVGSFGDAGCFSFYPTKNLGSYGDGGMVVTDNKDLAKKVELLRNYGQSRKYYHDEVAVNSRLDELQAAVLGVKLSHLNEWNERRRRLAGLYVELLDGTNVTLPVEKGYAKHVYHLFVVRLPQRDVCQRSLQKAGIQTQIHYPIPVHKQKAYAWVANATKLEETEVACDQILSLPLYPCLTRDEVAEVAGVMKRACC